MMSACFRKGSLMCLFFYVLLFETALSVLIEGTNSGWVSYGKTGLVSGDDAGVMLPEASVSKPGIHEAGEERSSHGLHYSHSWRGSRGDLLEKTRPFFIVDGHRKRLSEVLQNGHPDKIQCGLQFEGHTYLLDLEKNHGLLPKPPNVFYYLPGGRGVSADGSAVAHCYYHGSVRGFPDSRVALSTCSGLRGLIVVNASLSLELQPEEVECKEEVGEEDVHLLYSTHHPRSQTGGCGASNSAAVPPLDFTPPKRRSKRDVLSETKYIELVLVVDHAEYLYYQKNNRTIIYRMMDVANQVDWFYRPLNVRVVLLGLEIWSDQDKIEVDKNPTKTLNRFLEWRMRELLPRLRHDNAQLITGRAFNGTTVGMASQFSMCSTDRSGGVNVDHLVSVLGVASIVAHELGHNLGMRHDTEERRCQCQNEPRLGGCIMEPPTGLMPGQLFSNCSAFDLSVSLLHGRGMCLFNVPRAEQLLGGSHCGNLYVEKGEECDCGLADECKDPCCNHTTCKLVPGAECSSDSVCCDSCKLRPAGTVCRERLGECDLPEYCTGTSPHCPSNVFLHNGESCDSGASHCFNGVCCGVDTQCQALWGPGSSRAPDVCFSSVNKKGDRFGNCGQLSNGTYVPCNSVDVRCGKIQCQGGGSRPLLGSSTEVLITTGLRNLNKTEVVCRATSFRLGEDVLDPGMVADGTICGPGKICLGQRCNDISVLGLMECHRKCSGNGVCNSNKNCHCNEGWAPPDCKYAGPGGSVDSGPAKEPRGSNSSQVALLVVFLLVLPVVLCLLALHLCRSRRCPFWLGRTLFVKGSGRPQSRTPAAKRNDPSNGEQMQPLRYQWPNQVDIPLTPPCNKDNDKPPPPNKPLPPDPAHSRVVKSTQSEGVRPAPPNKPLPPDPIPKVSQLAVERPAPPNRPLPPDPVLTGSQSRGPPKPPPPKKPQCAESQSHAASGRPTSAVFLQQTDSASFPSSNTPHVAVIPARRPPPPPVRTSQPRMCHLPPPV